MFLVKRLVTAKSALYCYLKNYIESDALQIETSITVLNYLTYTR